MEHKSSDSYTLNSLCEQSTKHCIQVYMHYHVSQLKHLPKCIVDVWQTGQELYHLNLNSPKEH